MGPACTLGLPFPTEEKSPTATARMKRYLCVHSSLIPRYFCLKSSAFLQWGELKNSKSVTWGLKQCDTLWIQVWHDVCPLGTRLESWHCGPAKAAGGILGSIRTVASRPREVTRPLCSALVWPPPECWAQYRAPQCKREMELQDGKASKGDEGTGASPIGEKAERAGTVQPTGKAAQGNNMMGYKHLKGGCKGGRARLFPVVSAGRAKGKGHKLSHRSFQLNNSKRFLTVSVTEHWHRLPREVVQSPILGHLHKLPGHGSGQAVLADPA